MAYGGRSVSLEYLRASVWTSRSHILLLLVHRDYEDWRGREKGSMPPAYRYWNRAEEAELASLA